MFLALATLYPNDRLSGFAMATKTCRAAKLYQRPCYTGNICIWSVLGGQLCAPIHNTCLCILYVLEFWSGHKSIEAGLFGALLERVPCSRYRDTLSSKDTVDVLSKRWIFTQGIIRSIVPR